MRTEPSRQHEADADSSFGEARVRELELALAAARRDLFELRGDYLELGSRASRLASERDCALKNIRKIEESGAVPPIEGDVERYLPPIGELQPAGTTSLPAIDLEAVRPSAGRLRSRWRGVLAALGRRGGPAGQLASELALARQSLIDLRAAYARLEQRAARLAPTDPARPGDPPRAVVTALQHQLQAAHERLQQLQTEHNDLVTGRAELDDELVRRQAEQAQAGLEIDRLHERLTVAEQALAATREAEKELAAALEKATDQQTELEQARERLTLELEQRSAELETRDRQWRAEQAGQERLRVALAARGEQLTAALRDREFAVAESRSLADELHRAQSDAAETRRIDRATIEDLEGLLVELECRLQRADGAATRLETWLRDGSGALQPPPIQPIEEAGVAPLPKPGRVSGLRIALGLVVLLGLVVGGSALEDAFWGADGPPPVRDTAAVRATTPPAPAVQASAPPEATRREADPRPTDPDQADPQQADSRAESRAAVIAALEATAAPTDPASPSAPRATGPSSPPVTEAATGDSRRSPRQEAPVTAAARTPIVSLPSGLRYRVLKEGRADGRTPQAGDTVTVRYRGLLPDGREFDSSERRGGPVNLAIAQAVPGWREALLEMREGAQWELYVPPGLAIPRSVVGVRVAPDLPLTYQLELLAIHPPPGR